MLKVVWAINAGMSSIFTKTVTIFQVYKTKVSMTRKCHTHILQTYPRYREEEAHIIKISLLVLFYYYYYYYYM